jgi:hypothetical protein
VTRHLPHLLMLVLPLLVFVGVFGLQWRAAADEQLPAPLWAMVATTVGAASIHGAMTAHHAREAALLGWAMAVMAVVQLAWAVAVLFVPVRRTVEVGVVGNLSVVVLWAWTRLVGVPFGITGGVRQRIGVWDATCTLLEVVAVLAGLAWVLTRTSPAVPVLPQARLKATPSM